MSSKADYRIPAHSRSMVRKDIPEILEIDSSSFEFPLDEQEVIRLLMRKNCFSLVCEYQEEVISYVIYELKSNELEIIRFAVRQNFRKRGIGSQMIDLLANHTLWERSPQMANANGKNQIVVRVRETNLAIQLFFREYGFRASKTLRDYYEDTGESAYHMFLNVLS